METRGERIAGEDKKITQDDIEKLKLLDPNGDLKIAQEVLPPDFFKQLEAGKWFGIGNGSLLKKEGYIEKLNSASASYIQEKHEVIEKSQESLQNVAFKGEWKYQGVLSAGNKKRKDEIYNLQVALYISGEKLIQPDGVWGNETRKAMKKLVSKMPYKNEGYESGTVMDQIIFDFLYRKIFPSRTSESLSLNTSFSASNKRNVPKNIEIQGAPEKNERAVKFTRTLRLTSPRMKGQDIKLLQQKLTEAGYDIRDILGNFDGIFGPKTQQALKRYQQEKLGQKGDGVMDFKGLTQQSFEIQMNTQVKKDEIGTTEKGLMPENKTKKPSSERFSISPNMKMALGEVGIQDPNIQRKIEGSLVNIGIGWGGGGTGAFIAPNLILTAEHVLRDLNTGNMNLIGTIRGADGKIYHVAKIFIDSSNNDIGYIQTKEESESFLEYAPNSSKVRSEGILLGFSGGKPRFYAPGKNHKTKEAEALYNRRDKSRYGKTMFVDFPSQKGDSGGPIVDQNGKILGIIVRSYEYGSKRISGGIAEPIDDIANSSKVIVS